MSNWWDDVTDSLGSLFDTTEDEPLRKSHQALRNPTMASTGYPDFDRGMATALQANEPIIERSSKLMQQIYEPDHLSTPQLAGQALAAFLPTLLGRAIGGNRGGVTGAQAGLAAQAGVAGAQQQAAEFQRRSAIEEYQSEKVNFDANVKQAQGLQTAGTLLKRQDILGDRNQERAQENMTFAGGISRENNEASASLSNHYAMLRMDKQEANRAAREVGGEVGGDSTVALLGKEALEQQIITVYGDDPRAAAMLATVRNLGPNAKASDLEKLARIVNQEATFKSQRLNEEQQLHTTFTKSGRALDIKADGIDQFTGAMESGRTFNVGMVTRSIMNMMGVEKNPSDKEAASMVAASLPSDLRKYVNYFFGPNADQLSDSSSMDPALEQALINITRFHMTKIERDLAFAQQDMRNVYYDGYLAKFGKVNADRYFGSLGKSLSEKLTGAEARLAEVRNLGDGRAARQAKIAELTAKRAGGQP